MVSAKKSTATGVHKRLAWGVNNWTTRVDRWPFRILGDIVAAAAGKREVQLKP